MKMIFLMLGIFLGSSYADESCRKGLTFGLRAVNEDYGTVMMGARPTGDAYEGDTACSEKKPILCIKVFSAINPGINNDDEYNKWSAGRVRITAPVQGLQLKSREIADKLCELSAGKGYRMAEFHDGWGWNFQAYGYGIPEGTRFWTAINDQRANCWD